MRIGLVATNSPAYIDAALGILERGDTVVPLPPINNDENAKIARVSSTVRPQGGSGWLVRTYTPKRDDRVAQISFTSGTEGPPKGILLTHRALSDVHDRLQATMKLDKSIREYVGIPVYHSFGYARCRTICAIGGAAFIPNNGFHPTEIASMLRRDEINSISAVPSLWRLLFKHTYLFGSETTKIRWIEIGSQYMTASEKIRLRELFPNATIVQHYGLTEASRTTLLEVHREDVSRLESVGKATGDVGLRIGQDGLIQIRGPHVATSALIDGREEQLTDGDGWFRTNDLGRIEGDYLHYEGRADDVINCGGIKVHAEALQNRMHEILGATGGFGVARSGDPMRGDGIVVAVEHSCDIEPEALRLSAIEALRSYGLNAPSSVSLFKLDKLPTTATGKLQRKLISDLSEGRSTDKPAPATNSNVLDIFRQSFDNSGVRANHSFAELSGDSLLYIQVSLLLEQALGHIPQGWEKMTITELESLNNSRADKSADAEILTTSGQATRTRTKSPALPQGASNRNPPNIGFWALVREDFQTHGSSVASQGFIALFVNRFGNWRMSIRRPFRAPFTAIYRILNPLCQMLCGIKLDYTVAVGRRVKLEHFGGMIIGARQIGNGVIIRQNTTLGIRHLSDLNAKPTIEDNVDIGAGAVILGNITIGRGSVIGANAVVLRDVPPFSLVEPMPATVTTLLKRSTSDRGPGPESDAGVY